MRWSGRYDDDAGCWRVWDRVLGRFTGLHYASLVEAQREADFRNRAWFNDWS